MLRSAGMTLEILSLLPNGLQCSLGDMRASVRLPSVLWRWDSMNCTNQRMVGGGRGTIFLPALDVKAPWGVWIQAVSGPVLRSIARLHNLVDFYRPCGLHTLVPWGLHLGRVPRTRELQQRERRQEVGCIAAPIQTGTQTEPAFV